MPDFVTERSSFPSFVCALLFSIIHYNFFSPKALFAGVFLTILQCPIMKGDSKIWPQKASGQQSKLLPTADPAMIATFTFYFVHCTHVFHFSASFCTAHCALDLARDHAP